MEFDGFLEYAEVQALQHKPVALWDWIVKLDELPKISARKLQDYAGKISAESAKAKAEQEYDCCRPEGCCVRANVTGTEESARARVEEIGKGKPA